MIISLCDKFPCTISFYFSPPKLQVPACGLDGFLLPKCSCKNGTRALAGVSYGWTDRWTERRAVTPRNCVGQQREQQRWDPSTDRGLPAVPLGAPMESHVPIPSFGHFKTPPETDLCVCRLLQPSLGTSFGGAMSPACTRPQHTQLKHLVLLVLPHVALKELLCACAQGHTPHLLLTALFPASCGQQFEGGNKGEFPGPPKKTLGHIRRHHYQHCSPSPARLGTSSRLTASSP